MTATTKYDALPRDIHPPWKWAGGKRNLAAHIIARMPPGNLVYHEPFFGGGAVFFELYKRKRLVKAFINDVNPEIFNALTVIKAGIGSLVAELKLHERDHGEDYYYDVRALPVGELGPVKRAARFLYLNKTCYNGLYRVNKKGIFNAPFGRYKKPAILDEDNLIAVHEALDCSTLLNVDFGHAMNFAKRGETMYLDPPYLPVKVASKKDAVSSTSFTAYDASKFGVPEHQRLFMAFDAATKTGVHVILSNSDTPAIRELYKNHHIDVVAAPRYINRDPAKRGDVNELLITRKR